MSRSQAWGRLEVLNTGSAVAPMLGWAGALLAVCVVCQRVFVSIHVLAGLDLEKTSKSYCLQECIQPHPPCASLAASPCSMSNVVSALCSGCDDGPG